MFGHADKQPHHHPNATPPELVDRISEMKREHPLTGPKKVIGRLRLIEPQTSFPSPSTVGVMLDRAGLVKLRRRRRRSSSWGEPFSRRQEAKRRVVDRLQGVVPQRRRDTDRPSDCAGRGIEVSAGV